MKGFKISALTAVLLFASACMVLAGPTYDRVMKDKVVKAGITNKGKPFGFIDAGLVITSAICS